MLKLLYIYNRIKSDNRAILHGLMNKPLVNKKDYITIYRKYFTQTEL